MSALHIAVTLTFSSTIIISLAKGLGLPVALFSSASVAVIAVVLLMMCGCVKWKTLEQGIHWGY